VSVELNWREGEEAGDVAWEVAGAQSEQSSVAIVTAGAARPARSRAAVPFLLALLAGVILGTAGLAAFVLARADRAGELARRDVETALAQLAVAQRSGDLRGYAALLDPSDAVWMTAQVAALRSQDPPAGEPRVLGVELKGDLARAEVLETAANGAPATRYAFFRLVAGQWLLAAPVAEMLGSPAVRNTPHFVINYRAADEPLIDSLVDLAEGGYVILCSELRCQPASHPIPLTLDYDGPNVTDVDGLVVASPGLLGVEPAGNPGAAFHGALVEALGGHLAGEKTTAASPALRSAVGLWARAELAPGASPGEPARLPAQGQSTSLAEAWRRVALQNRDGAAELALTASLLSYARATYGSDAVGQVLEAIPGDLAAVVRRAFQTSAGDFEAGWQEWSRSVE
jgi:hypothetical protein